MAIVPARLQDFLTFAEDHGVLWTSVFAQIGISTVQASAYKANAILARSKYNDQVAADGAKRAATAATQDAVSDLRGETADLLALIKAHADNSADPGAVYQAAQIPAPSTPQPAPPPGTPTDYKVGLEVEGWVTLSWKCANPAGTTGTIYEVRRKLGSSAFQFVGATSARRFTDDTLPSGNTTVIYQITGVRSTTRGQSSQVNVNFGIGGDGFTIQSVKLAA